MRLRISAEDAVDVGFLAGRPAACWAALPGVALPRAAAVVAARGAERPMLPLTAGGGPK